MNQLNFEKVDKYKEFRNIVQTKIIELGKKASSNGDVELEKICIKYLGKTEYASLKELRKIENLVNA